MRDDSNEEIMRRVREFFAEHAQQYNSYEEQVEAFLAFFDDIFDEEDLLEFIDAMDNEDYDVEMRSMHLVDIANFEFNEQAKRQKLEEALELWPDNWFAQLELLEGNLTERLDQIRQLLQDAYEWEEDHRDEMLPFDYLHKVYTSFIGSVGSLFYQEGLLTEALEIFEYLREEADWEFVYERYEMMACYVRMYDFDGVMDLYRDWPIDVKEDSRLQIQVIAVALLTANSQMAKEVFRDLRALVGDSLGDLLTEDELPMERIGEQGDLMWNPIHEPTDFESVLRGLYDVFPVIINSDYFFDWMKGQYQARQRYDKVHVNDKVISFKGIKELQESMKTQFKPLNEILFGLGKVQRQALEQVNLTSLEAFQNWTEQQVLEIKHIGYATIQLLKENGVKFKQKDS